MNQKTYNQVTGLIFSVVAVVHIFRLANRWEANIAGWPVPLLGSALAAVVAVFLAYSAYKLMK
ncbi:hypothetical protein HYS94_00905 [Candidatus Daviesbacteria bacterium]|nr:hypothetical protein [Candidatus Daviesbacteria bacterium]